MWPAANASVVAIRARIVHGTSVTGRQGAVAEAGRAPFDALHPLQRGRSEVAAHRKHIRPVTPRQKQRP